jgi:YidC/Oxa1 family membrane protein insertase
MSLTTYISQRQLMSRQAAQVNPQQQMLMRIMPLMFFVFAINVPLALIIYWVTTNFWSVGQQYMLLRTAPPPAGAAAGAGGATAPAPAPALTDEGGGRKGLGLLGLFRGSSQPRAEPPDRDATSRNGERPARAGEGKAPEKPPRSGGKSGQAKPGQAKPGQGGRQGGSGRQGTGGGRRSGSRSSGKGKASGPRRGKR